MLLSQQMGVDGDGCLSVVGSIGWYVFSGIEKGSQQITWIQLLQPYEHLCWLNRFTILIIFGGSNILYNGMNAHGWKGCVGFLYQMSDGCNEK